MKDLLSEETNKKLKSLINNDITDLTTPSSRRRPSATPAVSASFQLYWAKVTAVTDANNYTCDIYNDRNESTATETGKAVRVWDIVNVLSAGDWFPVQKSNITDKDYESAQQIGLL
jgi:hypothetical protein